MSLRQSTRYRSRFRSLAHKVVPFIWSPTCWNHDWYLLGVQLSQNVPVVCGILVINMTFNSSSFRHKKSWRDSTPCNFHRKLRLPCLAFGSYTVWWFLELNSFVGGCFLGYFSNLENVSVVSWYLSCLCVVLVGACCCCCCCCCCFSCLYRHSMSFLVLSPTKCVWFMKATVSTPNPWFVQRTALWRIFLFSGRRVLGRPVIWGMFSSRCRRWISGCRTWSPASAAAMPLYWFGYGVLECFLGGGFKSINQSICFIFTPTWGNDPIWLVHIFLQGVGSTTTNRNVLNGFGSWKLRHFSGTSRPLSKVVPCC